MHKSEVMLSVLGPPFQKIALAQRRTLKYTLLYWLTTGLMNCTPRTAVILLFLLSITYFLLPKKRQRMHIPTKKKKKRIRFNLAVR